MNDSGPGMHPGHRTTRLTSDSPSLARSALGYAAHGWSVVPAPVASKRALVPWKPWQVTPADVGQVGRWWQRWPRANVGIVTGRVSNLVVVDIDVRHGGEAGLAQLEREHGDLPWSAVTETPSGGWHIYLAHPGFRVANSAGRLAAGVDVRGDGGLVLAPPSQRTDGCYRWAFGGPADVPGMPASWGELLRPRPRSPRASGVLQTPGGTRDAARVAGLLRALQRAPEGQRNAVLYWAGCRLAEMVEAGAPASWADVLERAGVAIGLDLGEVRDTLASALSGRSG
jgi:Bifunctional DNA primase/polymerase, N-terminal